MRVLVVEDEALIAMSIVADLEHSGHEVVGVARSYAEAQALASSGHPAVALVDIDLQRPAEGLDVVRVLKSTYDVPALFVTGQIEVAREHADLALGVIRKPFHTEDIVLGLTLVERLKSGIPIARDSVPRAIELFGPLI